MNGIGTTLLIVLILLTYVFARSLDATRIHVPDKRDSFCGEHVQAKYCRADFGGEMARTGRTPFPGDYRVTKDDTFAVLKATVRNETTSHEDNRLYRVYPIVIKTQIKITPQFMTLSDDTISTLYYLPTAHGKMASLRSGTKYLLSGSLQNINGSTRMVINSCDWVQAWSSIGHRHKASLRKAKFEQGCNCRISLFASTNEKQSSECSLNYRGTQLENAQNCYQRHSFCFHKSPNKCSWSNNQEVKQCLLTGLR